MQDDWSEDGKQHPPYGGQIYESSDDDGEDEGGEQTQGELGTINVSVLLGSKHYLNGG